MTQFFDGPGASSKIVSLLRDANAVKFAVAYWGQGAIETLALNELSHDFDIQIICDLMSGACNPEVVRLLQCKFGVDRVHILDRLHAKVWIVSENVIIGSSNASTNGFGTEGTDATFLLEANLLTKDSEAVEQAKKWFDKMWRKSREFTQKDIDKATQRWARNKNTDTANRSNSIFQALKIKPDFLAEIEVQVWIWAQEERDNWAETKLEEFSSQKKRRNLERLGMIGNSKEGEISCFQNVECPPEPGCLILSFDIEGGRVRLESLSKIIQTSSYEIDGETHSLTYCFDYCRPWQKKIKDLPLGRAQDWYRSALAAWNENQQDWEGSVTDFARQFIAK